MVGVADCGPTVQSERLGTSAAAADADDDATTAPSIFQRLAKRRETRITLSRRRRRRRQRNESRVNYEREQLDRDSRKVSPLHVLASWKRPDAAETGCTCPSDTNTVGSPRVCRDCQIIDRTGVSCTAVRLSV